MKEAELFAAALNLKEPWFVRRIEFPEVDEGEMELHIEVDHAKHSKFEYEGKSYPVYDHQYRSWSHLQFFQHDCYLNARVPRVKTDEGSVLLVSVPWAHPGSSFTLLFKLHVLKLFKRGYRNKQNFILMIYFKLGGLNLGIH